MTKRSVYCKRALSAHALPAIIYSRKVGLAASDPAFGHPAAAFSVFAIGVSKP